MTFDYTRSVATADRLITRFGQSGFLRRKTNSGTAHNPTVTTEDLSVTFVVIDYTSKEVDGTRVLATDRKVLMKAAVTPLTTDLLLDPSVPGYKVVSVKTLNPAGTAILHEVQARR